MTILQLKDQTPAGMTVDALVVFTTASVAGSDAAGPAALAAGHGLDRRASAHVRTALTALETKGARGEVHTLSGVPGVSATRLLLVGTGPAPAGRGATFDAEVLREAAGFAVRAAGSASTVALVAPAPTAHAVAALGEGALLGAYTYTKATGGSGSPGVSTITILTGRAKDKDVRAAAQRAQTLADAQDWARDLVNSPPNVLYPESFAAAVTERAKGGKVKVSVLDEKGLDKAGCGGILGVGQGSARPPRLVTLRYRSARAKAHLALVGKGITFDSGGLCIKPGPSMVTMKCDMAGAAVVAAAVLAIAELAVPVAVTAFLCIAENMPGANAQRPGDVVRMHGGKTVEIINTDAEGRLVMADGLVFATEESPDAIVDVATLTGAQVMALGERVAGLMSNDEAFRGRVGSAADVVGEQLWAMPMPEYLRDNLDTPFADLKHTGDRTAGMLTAATFLEAFVGDGFAGKNHIPWAHVDLAGPAYNDGGARSYTPKGGTGFGTRTLVSLAQSYVDRPI